MSPRRIPLALTPALALALLACPKSGTTEQPDAAKPDADTQPTADGSALNADFLRDFTRDFSADALGGRLPGSEGGAMAVAMIIATMEAIGLEPAGDDGGWTQRVGMRGVTLDRETSKLTLVDKKGKTTDWTFGDQWVGTSFAEGSDHAIDADLVFLGYGVTAPEYQWDDYAGVDVKGKVVMVFVGDPPTTDGSFGGPAMTYYGRWTYKYERALAAGAAGCLVIHEDAPASYGWNVPTTSYSSERFHILGAGGVVQPAMAMRGWVSAAAADELAKRGGKSLEQWHELAMRPDFQPISTKLKVQGTLHTSERRVEDVNVLGRLPGAVAPEQAVFLTGHWDHLGTDQGKIDAGEDGIYNGAIDNASGVANMLGVAAELKARAAAGAPLDRSVVFLATTAEEQGLLGARHYAAHPLVPLADTVAVINMDALFPFGATKGMTVVALGSSELEEYMADAARAVGRELYPDPAPQLGAFFRSDHYPFAAKGVPAIFAVGGPADDPKVGETVDLARYEDYVGHHYHQVSDEYDPERWDLTGIVQDVEVYFRTGWAIANDDRVPNWYA
ncbi:MAG: M28 family peptidase, partial [Myxococcales bacterium]|nr:M28 family peptidase [Myxococcales bacterium]